MFFLLLLLVGVATYRDYGLAWDELELRSQMGQRFLDYALGGNRQELMKNDINVYHGPALEMCFVALERLLGQTDPKAIFELRHLLNFLLFITAVAAFYALGKTWFGDWRLALFGAGLLVLCPRIYSDHFYNSKDASFLSLYVIATWSMTRFCLRPGPANGAVHALACGFLIGVRNLGIIIPPLTLLLLAGELLRRPEMRRPYRWLPGLALHLLLLPLFIVLFWPTLWRYPVTHFVQALKVNGKFPWLGDIMFMGHRVLSTKLPWYYAPVWMVVTLPFFHLALFASGACSLAMDCVRRPLAFARTHFTASSPVFSTVYTLTVPLAAVIALKAVLYNGWRHLYFIYPAMVALALFGARRLLDVSRSRPVLRSTLLAITAGSGLLILVQTVRLHPYEHLYFNRLAGRNLEQARQRFEMDPLGLAYRKGVEYIAAHDDSPEIVVRVADAPGEYNANLLPEKDRKRLRFTYSGDADYFVSNYTLFTGKYVFPDEVFALRRDDTTLLSVFRLRQPRPVAAAPPAAPAASPE